MLDKHKLAPKILGVVNELLSRQGFPLRVGTTVDANLIAALSSTKNRSGERAPELKQSQNGQQRYFGMKAHNGMDAEPGLAHIVRGTDGCVKDVVEATSALHGEETEAFGDAGCHAHVRPRHQPSAPAQPPHSAVFEEEAGSWRPTMPPDSRERAWTARSN